MKVEIRRLLEPIAAFECTCCGKQVKRGPKFEYRYPQYVIDYIPKMLAPLCRNCIYKITYNTKGVMKFKKANTIEIETPKYDNID